MNIQTFVSFRTVWRTRQLVLGNEHAFSLLVGGAYTRDKVSPTGRKETESLEWKTFAFHIRVSIELVSRAPLSTRL